MNEGRERKRRKKGNKRKWEERRAGKGDREARSG
jgi:hypothetical protein